MKLTFRHALVLSFCTVFIVAANSLLSGDIKDFAISATLFLLLYARSVLNHRFSSTATAILATLLLLFTGAGLYTVGKSILLPALIIDLLALLYPPAIASTVGCTATATLAYSTPVLWEIVQQLLAGTNPLVALQKSVSAFGITTVFAMLGGLPVYFLARKTKGLTTASKAASTRKSR